jgi:hypothetical protein
MNPRYRLAFRRLTLLLGGAGAAIRGGRSRPKTVDHALCRNDQGAPLRTVVPWTFSRKKR